LIRGQWALISLFFLPAIGKLRGIIRPEKPVNTRQQFGGAVGCVDGMK